MKATGMCVLFLVSVFIGLSAQRRSDSTLRLVIRKLSNNVPVSKQYQQHFPTHFEHIPRKLGIFNGRQFSSKRSLNNAYKIREHRELGTYFQNNLVPRIHFTVQAPPKLTAPMLVPIRAPPKAATDTFGNPLLVPKTDEYGSPYTPKPLTDTVGNPILVPLPFSLLPITDSYGLPHTDSNGVQSIVISKLPITYAQSTSVKHSTISNQQTDDSPEISVKPSTVSNQQTDDSPENSVKPSTVSNQQADDSPKNSVNEMIFVYIALGVVVPLLFFVIVVSVIRGLKRRDRQIRSLDASND